MQQDSKEESRLSKQFSIRVTQAEYDAIQRMGEFDHGHKVNTMARIAFRLGLPLLVTDMRRRGLDIETPPDPDTQE